MIRSDAPPQKNRRRLPVPCLLSLLVCSSFTALADTELPAFEVTARRVVEPAQQVPVSVAVAGREALARRQITTGEGLQEVIAGLQVSTPNQRLPSLTIRGLGGVPFNEGQENSVAVFVDGFYVARPGAVLSELVDIERVEVARGPQSTLFGKNATAGTISLITRRPTRQPEADLELTLGEFGTQQVRAAVSGPFSDTQSGRLAVYQSQRDGLIDNRFDNRPVNGIDRQGLRGQWLWQPIADFSLRLIGETGRTDETCCAFPLFGTPTARIAASDAYVGYQRVSGALGARQTDTDIRPRSQVAQDSLGAEARWQLTPQRTLVSLTDVRRFDFRPTTDDNTSLRLVQGGTSTEHRQISQEFRLETQGSAVDTVSGVYFLDQRVRGQEDVRLGRDLADWVFGGLVRQAVPGTTRNTPTGALLSTLIPAQTFDGMTITTPFEQHSQLTAAFSQATWHARPWLDLSGGLRVEHERKSTTVSRNRTGGNPNASPLALTNSLAPLVPVLGPPIALVSFDQLINETAGGPFQREQSLSEQAVSGHASATVLFSPAWTSYVSFNRGVKSGGVNLGVTGAASNPVFRPEVAESAELGVKWLGWDERAAVSLAAFHTRVRDYQAVTFDESPTLIPNPRLNNILNVGRVTLEGADLDARLQLPAQVSVQAGVSYVRAITESFTNAPDEDQRRNVRDLSGQPLANAPRWQGHLALLKVQDIGSRVQLYGEGSVWFRSDYNATVERSRATDIDGFAVVGARVGIRDRAQSWDWSIFVRNLTDEVYPTAITALYGIGDYGAYAGDPRLIGSTLRLRFH